MSTYTPSLGLELITPGSQAGLWGNTTNNSLNLIDQAITGVTPINFASASGSTYTLTDFNGAEDEARSAVINVTGSATGSNTIVVPNKQKTYLVRNNTGQNVVFQTASPGNTYTVEAGYSILIFCDGNNNVYTGIASPSVGTLSVSGGGTGTTSFGAGGFVKSTGGANALTAASKVALGSDVSGTLPVASGGTGQSTLTSGALLVGNGTGAVAVLSGGTVGYVPTWAGSTWVAAAPAAAGVSTLTAGGGIQVNGGSGPASGSVTISNSGVTSLTAGTGITLSGSTGGITISATGTSGVSTFNGRSGAVTPQSSDYSSYYLSTSGTAANSLALGGVAAASYLTNSSGTAYNSDRLGNVLASSYLTASSGTAYDSARLGGTLASSYLTASSGTAYDSSRLGGAIANDYMQKAGGVFSGAVTFNTAPTSLNWSFNSTTGFALAGANVYLNMSGATPYTFQSNGIAYASNAWQSLSDQRVKENVQTLALGLDTVTALNPVEYSFKRDGLSAANHYGFIAQEIESIIPNVVSNSEMSEGDNDNLKAVSYTEIIPILVKAIQELKAEVELLKAR